MLDMSANMWPMCGPLCQRVMLTNASHRILFKHPFPQRQLSTISMVEVTVLMIKGTLLP